MVGLVRGDDVSIGIFVNQAKAALRLKLGEDYQGWRLRTVQAREVTLERDQKTAILTLPQPNINALLQVRAENDAESDVHPGRSVP